MKRIIKSEKVRTLVREGAIVLFISVFCILLATFCDKVSKSTDTEPVAQTTPIQTTISSTSTVTTTTTTTVTTTATTTTTTTTTTTKVVTKPVIVTTTTTTQPVETTEAVTEISTATNEECIGTFKRGTYYAFGSVGGSGRKLVSGYSIASRALYEMYGYGDYKIRIECDRFPQLNGIYSLDDCSAKGNNQVIDFWFAPNEVPDFFRKYGVLEVRAYIIR